MRPSASTVHKTLSAQGLVKKAPVQVEKNPSKPRFFERTQPNQMWQADIFCFRLGGKTAYLIGYVNDYSRYVTGLDLFRSQTAEHVLEVYRQAIGEYGVPKEMLTDNGRIIGLIEAEEKGPARLVINRIKSAMVKRGDMLSPDDVLELLAVELIGLIPEDDHVVMSTNQGVPIVLNGKSNSAQAFRDIASRLKGEEVPFMPLDDDRGIFKRLRRLIRPEGN